MGMVYITVGYIEKVRVRGEKSYGYDYHQIRLRQVRAAQLPEVLQRRGDVLHLRQPPSPEQPCGEQRQHNQIFDAFLNYLETHFMFMLPKRFVSPSGIKPNYAIYK